MLRCGGLLKRLRALHLRGHWQCRSCLPVCRSASLCCECSLEILLPRNIDSSQQRPCEAVCTPLTAHSVCAALQEISSSPAGPARGWHSCKAEAGAAGTVAAAGERATKGEAAAAAGGFNMLAQRTLHNVTHRGCGISRVVYLQGCQHTHCIPRGHCWLPVFSCAGQGVCRRQRHVGEQVWCFQSKPLTNLQQHS